ncbi:hypothetical protein [Bacillus sp. AK031]
MLVEMRKTQAGTEYWDTKKKKTVFVKRGVKPSFEVTENPKSMLEEEKLDTETDIELDQMDADQLLEFAKQNDIEVPRNMKKADTIRNHIEESLAAAEE